PFRRGSPLTSTPSSGSRPSARTTAAPSPIRSSSRGSDKRRSSSRRMPRDSLLGDPMNDTAKGSAKMDERMNPAEVEPRWYAEWENQGVFHASDTIPRPPFSIVIPPPNVTGILHMGHALNNTFQDVIVRWRRMQGRNACWIPGTDHAGI